MADILAGIKEGTINVSKLSRETGIPASRMYKWKVRPTKITAEDSEILDKWIEKLDNSPENAPSESLEPDSGDKTPAADKEAENISALIASNSKLSDAVKLQAEVDLNTSKNYAKLIDMIENPKSRNGVKKNQNGDK